MSKKRTPSRSNYKKPVQNPVDPKKNTLKIIIGAVALLAVVIIVLAVLSFVTHEGIDEAEHNWVIERVPFNNSNVYYQLAEVGEIEGYTLDPDAATRFLGELDRTVTYVADSEEDPINQIMFYFAGTAYDQAAEDGLAALAKAEEGLEHSEAQIGEAYGLNYSYFIYSADAVTEEKPEGKNQCLVAYVEYDEDSSIMINVFNSCDSAEGLTEDDVLLAALDKSLAALTLVE